MRDVSNGLTELARDPPFHKKIRHPPCITSLLHQGIPDDIDNDRAFSIIARYVVARGLDDKQGERMAQTMVHNSPSLSVMKVKESPRGGQFRLVKQRNRNANRWSCTEVLSSKRLRERRMCKGWQCEYYSPAQVWGPHPKSSTEEIRLEQALLTYVFNNPESVTEGLQLKLQSEAFVGVYTCRDGVSILLNRALWHICGYLARQDREIRSSTVLHLLSRFSRVRPYADEIARYVQDVATRTPCRHDVFLKGLLQVRERGMEQHLQALVYAAASALRSHTLPLDIILHTLEEQTRALSATTGDVIHKLDDDLPNFIATFFVREHHAVPTSSSWLNSALGGGWKLGSAYAVYASCDVEATDFAAWCIDKAAWCSHQTLHVSCDKSRDEIGLEALARHGNVETNDLLTQRGRIFDSAESKAVLEQLISGGERLSKRIAQHVWTLQADDQTSIADIVWATRAIQHHDGMGHDKPVLLLIDHLSAIAPDEKRVASGNSKRGSLEGHAVLAALKRSMSNPKVAIIAVFVADIASNEGRSKESVTDSASLEHFKKLSAADYTLTLYPHDVEIEGLNGKKIVDQLDIAREWYKCRYSEHRERIQRCFDELRDEYPADKATYHYARIALCKKGGSVLSNPLILYEPSLRRFQPADIEPMNFEEKIRAFSKTNDDGRTNRACERTHVID